jgi:hypothetical protein
MADELKVEFDLLRVKVVDGADDGAVDGAVVEPAVLEVLCNDLLSYVL